LHPNILLNALLSPVFTLENEIISYAQMYKYKLLANLAPAPAQGTASGSVLKMHRFTQD
jgi:hypothetical protein